MQERAVIVSITPLTTKCYLIRENSIHLARPISALRSRVSVDSLRRREWSPLHAAAAVGAVNVVRTLVRQGADVNAKNNSGRTPMHIAAEKNLRHAVSELLACDADLNMQDRYGDTPLDRALKCRALDAAGVLIPLGARAASPRLIASAVSSPISSPVPPARRAPLGSALIAFKLPSDE
jgi:ankyrin repeat protein